MVTLDQIVPEEVVVYMEAGPGAMGDAGAIEFYSIHGNEVLYFYGNTVFDQNLDFDEVCRRLPDGLEYFEDGGFYSDRTKWKIFGGGMGNQFLIRSQYYPELKKMCENAPRGYYRRSTPYVEKLLLELASGARDWENGKEKQMVTKKDGKIEIDLGEELMKKLEAITDRWGTAPEELLRTYLLDYIVSGGRPELVDDSRS